MMKKNHYFLLLITCLLVILPACQQVEPAPIATIAPTVTSTPEPTATEIVPTMTSTTVPTPTLTKTSFGMKDLDKRTMYLFGDPATIAVEFLLEIQDCVRTENIEKLASLVRYPITIFLEGTDKLIIKDIEEFVGSYDSFATEVWKEIILAQDPMELFANWQGLMVHRGQLWFSPVCMDDGCEVTEYFIITISPRAPN